MGGCHLQLALHSCTQRHAAYTPGGRAADWTSYERQREVEAAAARRRLSQSAAVLKLQQAQRLRAQHGAAQTKPSLAAQYGAASCPSLPSSSVAPNTAAPNTAAPPERPPARPTRRQPSPSKARGRGGSARRGEHAPAGYYASCELLISPGLQLVSSLPYEIEVEIGRMPRAQPLQAPSRAPTPASSALAPSRAPSANQDHPHHGLRRGQLRPPLTIDPPPGAASTAEDESPALEGALITALGASAEAALCDVDCCAPRLMMRVRMRLPPTRAELGPRAELGAHGSGASYWYGAVVGGADQSPSSSSGAAWGAPVSSSSSSSSSSSLGDTWTRWSDPVELLPVQRDKAHDDAPTGPRAAPSAADDTAPSAGVSAAASAGVSAAAIESVSGLFIRCVEIFIIVHSHVPPAPAPLLRVQSQDLTVTCLDSYCAKLSC